MGGQESLSASDEWVFGAVGLKAEAVEVDCSACHLTLDGAFRRITPEQSARHFVGTDGGTLSLPDGPSKRADCTNTLTNDRTQFNRPLRP